MTDARQMRAMREALDELDDARRLVRWARVSVVGAAALLAGSITLWVLLFMWTSSRAGEPGVQRADAAVGLGMVLFILTALTVIGIALAVVFLFETLSERITAERAYRNVSMESL